MYYIETVKYPLKLKNERIYFEFLIKKMILIIGRIFFVKVNYNKIVDPSGGGAKFW